MGLVLHHVPEIVRQAHGVLRLSIYLRNELCALLLVARLPVFLLALDGAVVDYLTTGAAGEGDAFVSGLGVAGLAEVRYVHLGGVKTRSRDRERGLKDKKRRGAEESSREGGKLKLRGRRGAERVTTNVARRANKETEDNFNA